MKFIFLDSYIFLEGENRYFIGVKHLCRICNLVRYASGKFVILRGLFFCFIIVSRVGPFPLKRSPNFQFGTKIPGFIACKARGGLSCVEQYPQKSFKVKKYDSEARNGSVVVLGDNCL